MAVAVSSASGLLALLDEEDDRLKLHALQSLNRVVHEFWFQIAGSIASVEAFYEDEEFGHRELAALLASKVFYHLGELDDALTYALGAGPLFDLNEQSEYVQTILARCIDQYIAQRVKAAEDGAANQQAAQPSASGEASLDERLTAIVERMFDRCFKDGQFEQAVGIALESRRLDKLEEAIQKAPNLVKILTYALQVCQRLVISRTFREQVLRLLIRLYESAAEPDWVNVCQCLMFLDDTTEVAKILDDLLRGSQDDALLAYQIAFDLFENEMQSFLLKVEKELQAKAPVEADAAPAANGAGQAAGGGEGEGGRDSAATNGAGAADGMDTDDGAAAPLLGEQSKEDQQYLARFKQLKRIISGQVPISLYLEFLYSHNHADLGVLKVIKGAVESRVSITHSATIYANALMHSGTTVDAFLRENLDWLSRATNWAKFSATAGLGVIHRGHLSQGRALMAPYLPRNGAAGSPYSEGGALYALGLIHANHGQDIRDFLLESLRASTNEIIQHGACLGLGLAALGTNDEEAFEDLKGVLYTDSAVAGEAAGLALGLLTVGSATDKAAELLAYAHDTQHEKIIRGLALGLALISYAREEGAETLIEQMTRDPDPIIRYGGIYAIGLAYRGTANNAAIQKLLHFAVGDVSDDVRRAAVLNLGFLLMGVPEQCPRIVSLLAESYNPHVRYGAAMAVGISCGGSGMPEAVELLSPLLTDTVDYVRQGACIALALVLLQQPPPQQAAFRKQLNKFINDKHEEVMCRMGAIMAAGILDAGGRNVTLGLRSSSGYFRRTSVVALAVFTQYWYWYPLSYFLSLALQPTALIGLNADLQPPKLEFDCAAKASAFAYPPPITEETSVAVTKVPTAILSTTQRAKQKQKVKEAEEAEKQKEDGTGDAEATAEEAKPAEGAEGASAMDTEEDGNAAGAGPAAVEKAAKVKEEEAAQHTLANPARVVPAQEALVSFPEQGRWQPVHPGATRGILLLKDRTPGEPVELVSSTAPADTAAAPAPGEAGAEQPAAPAAQEEEPPPPEPFEYVPS